jgi:shikimate dehydrogenase
MTKIVGIFGDPIEHTLSPPMHNAAFRAVGLDWVYVPIRVRPRDLGAAVRGIRAMGWGGINVTIPHKQRVIRWLDRVSREARLTGAVNTVVCDRRSLLGHNTDGRGFVRALREEMRFDPRGRRIVILGAGGAARGIAVALILAGARALGIFNRTPRKAAALVRRLRAVTGRSRVAAGPLSTRALEAAFASADLVVNATSVGMHGSAHRRLPIGALPARAIVTDIVYQPLRTPLLEAAAKRGLRTQGGLGMLLYQGAEAFSLWTGRPAPIDVMRSALRRALARAGPT